MVRRVDLFPSSRFLLAAFSAAIASTSVARSADSRRSRRPVWVGRLAALLAVFCLCAAGARAATLTVNTLADSTDAATTCTTSGTCSLRDAITQAGSGDTINFSVTGTITLGSDLPAITASLTITGPGAGMLTVSGDNAYQLHRGQRHLDGEHLRADRRQRTRLLQFRG
jgi:ABC-type phosphate transport system substrate-binding protein